MKNFSLYLILLSSLTLISCGTSASYTANTGIEDGIYYNPDYASLKASASAEQAYIAELTSETKAAKIYSQPADTIRLGETRNVELPLEPEKTYVVLLDGETYQERLSKFDDDSDLTFSINFEYGFGAGYYGGWNPYYRWHGPSYYWGWHTAWYDPWYYPYYDPWYRPWYGPRYAWGWYDPWHYPYYDPWYYPWYGHIYPPVYPGFYPGPGGIHHHDVVYGRRELAHHNTRQNNAIRHTAIKERSPQSVHERGRSGIGENSGISQIRGREVQRTTPGNIHTQTQNTRQGSVNTGGEMRSSTTQRTGIRNSRQGNGSEQYRQSSSNSNRGKTKVSTSYSNGNSGAYSNTNRSGSSYQNSGSSHNSSRSTYSQSRNSGSSSGSSYRSSGSSSSGSSRSTGSRR